MTPGEKEEFFKWYKEASREIFNFEQEARRYCSNDVYILREACLRFRSEFLSETRVDPFSCITIASACMKVFLTNFLQPRTLAIPSPDDYRRRCKRYSDVSIQWLEWEAKSRNIFIQHALSKGEKQIGEYHVDGYAEIDGEKFAFEFLGCFYHGCPSCFQPHQKNPLTGARYEEMHVASEKKLEALGARHGLRTVVMREHTWREMTATQQGVKNFLLQFRPPDPLSPRQALFGGRTNAFRLTYTAGLNETVRFVDVTSLYPFVNSTCPYPLGHPTIVYRDFDDPQKYFGFIKAKVYPPRGLYFPVLPHKTASGKLMFTLCRTCAEINQQDAPCSHDDEARALTGVWVSLELNKALELGYRLAKIIEAWHFENQSGSIFTEYMRTFLKGKQEASGYPPGVTDDESKQKYIADYEANQGIALDPCKIRVNPAKRVLSKLCLNSLWGKFGQRPDLTQTTIIDEADEFLRVLFSGERRIKYFGFINDKTAMIQWNHKETCVVPPGKSSNVFVAAFTTAHARLRMYGYLERLQGRVLYTDTDSLIYTVKEGETALPLGKYLGDLTDELDGDTIQEFISAGPKSYAYQTKQTKKVVMRVKGITQTHEACEAVNFDSFKRLVTGYLGGHESGVIEVPQRRIVRRKESFLLENDPFHKKLRVVYDKRRLFPDGKTLPFGY